MPEWLSFERALALGGLTGLLVVAIVSVTLIASAGGDDDPEREAAATPAATATPTPTPTPSPTPVPLTPEQKAQRRAAAENVRGQGYEPVGLKAYDPERTLRVLLAKPSDATRAAGVPDGRRAFFFVGEQAIGTDTVDVSSNLKIARQTDRSVTLVYGLDTGDDARIRFVWDGTSLTPRTPIPPVDQRQQ